MEQENIILDNEPSEIPPKKKKNPFVIIGILLGVLVVLGILVSLLFIYNKNKSPYDDDRVIEKVTAFDETSVNKITVETTSENYTLVRNENVWEFEAPSPTTIEVSQGAVAKYISIFNSTISNDSAGDISEYDSLKEFGLEPANTTITMSLDTGKTMSFKVGSLSPYNNGTFYYCSNSPKIYIIDTEETDSMKADIRFFYNLLLGDVEIVGEVDPNMSSSAYNLDYINIYASFYDEDIKIRKQSEAEQEEITSLSAYVMTKPYNHPISSGAMKELYTFMKELSAVDIITDNTSKKSLKICGLDDPMYDIQYGWNGEEKRLRISEPIDDMCFAYKDGGKYIYAMPVEVADAFNKRPYEYCEDVAFLDKDLNYISEFNVTIGDKKYPFRISGEDLDIVVTLDGNPVDVQSFKQYFINVEGFMVKGETIILGNEKLLCSIEIKYRNNRKPDLLEFYEIDALSAILKENGKTKFTVDMNAVNNIIKDAENLKQGKKVDNIW